MALFDRWQNRTEADRLIAEFFAEQYPTGTRAELDSISELDVPFFDFWRKQNEQHGAACSERSVHGNCATCDALQWIRPGVLSGVSSELHRRALGASAGDPFGQLTIQLSSFRPSRAV